MSGREGLDDRGFVYFVHGKAEGKENIGNRKHTINNRVLAEESQHIHFRDSKETERRGEEKRAEL